MINHLYGKISFIHKNYIIIDVNGFGYKINIRGLDQSLMGTYKRIFIHSIIKNDNKNYYTIDYFGFSSPVERSLFADLLSVTGIGVAIASNIIDVGYKEIIDYIKNEDIESLKLIKGVNDKIARQIVAVLYNQYSSLGEIVSKQGNENNDLIKALKNLGYSDKDINYALSNMNKNLDIDEKIGQSIRLIAVHNESKC